MMLVTLILACNGALIDDLEASCYGFVDAANTCMLDAGAESSDLVNPYDECADIDTDAIGDSKAEIQEATDLFDCYADWFESLDCAENPDLDEHIRC